MSVRNLSRRHIVAALAGAPLLLSSLSGKGQDLQNISTKSLVVYFSRSGNTRVVAGLIQRDQQADLFEILPELEYPDDYLETVERSRQEVMSGFHPPLRNAVSDISQYDVVFVGFPIWGETAPPAVRAFLSGHDLSGKVVVPFIMHGGYGVGDSLQVVAQLSPGATVIQGFVMQGLQERRTMETVNEWLADLDV